MKSQRDKPPFLLFALLFLALLVVALSLVALDASAAAGVRNSDSQQRAASKDPGAAVTALAQGFAEYHSR